MRRRQVTQQNLKRHLEKKKGAYLEHLKWRHVEA